MKHIIKIFLLNILSVFVSCELLMDPLDDNHSNADRVVDDPEFAEGLLVSAYLKMPTNSYSFSEVATDDAVSNDKVNNYLRIATGQWTSSFNPFNQWQTCQEGIQYINHFLDIVEQVNWRRSHPVLNELYIKRFKGESYALRALLKYHLLVTVAGRGADGRLLGIPIFDQYLDRNSDFNIPRATFAESIENIYADIEQALRYLSMDDYITLSDESQLPAGYQDAGVDEYNIVFGYETTQRISGRMAKFLRARVALLAASPLFSNERELWAEAARYAGELLESAGGLGALDPDGHRFYLKEFVERLNIAGTPPVDQAEMIWRSPKTRSNNRERANFPPTLFGNGNVNPTQNLVDAFPMQNGYPIGHTSSQYDPADPYSGRDPRLGLYILHDGATYGGSVIYTGTGGKENAKDSIQTSTRTGYYLKKLLVEQVSLSPSAPSTENHYEVHMRYTELFLIYAEAANEAWGPDADPEGFGFTVRDVIGSIRERAGIDQPDTYLASIISIPAMRELIRNERRLELCFEGFRFWDLRRWNMDLNETAAGVDIERAPTRYRYVDIENRVYRDYMTSGPVPNSDLVKYSNLIQNHGW